MMLVQSVTVYLPCIIVSNSTVSSLSPLPPPPPPPPPPPSPLPSPSPPLLLPPLPSPPTFLGVSEKRCKP
uniref:Uncharacterized protein n=1 Tax=Vespula pensylvanica TaxID=30213 RepID=A0A834MY47_VESPE|nr:hypothetical protein H0235_017901 [Vespula pensylvanica]